MRPRARGVHQLSWVTGPRVQRPTGSTSCPRRSGPVPEVSWGRPAVLGDSGPGLKEHGVDQVSWVTRAFSQGPAELNFCPWRLGPRAPVVHQWSRATPVWVQGTTGSASSPGCFGPGSEGLRGQPALPGDLRLGPRSRGYDQCPRELGSWSEGLRGRPAVPRDSGPCPMSSGVHQVAQATRARV